jgi:site-specific DNA-methyltransferase (adenine-specific)
VSVRVLTGDCREVLKTLPDQSIQLGVTSPPYDGLRTYGGYSFDFPAVAEQLFRVLCPGGVVCWNVGDQVINGGESLTSMRQAIHFVDVCGFRMHDTMIYEKLNFANPERVRYHQMFEYVFILSKGAPRTFNAIKDKPNVYAGGGTLGKNTARASTGEMVERTRNINSEFGMRGNVWRGKTRGQESMCEPLDHPAMMPKWLARDLILSWSNEGDTVLDPFAGSGTTGQIAEGLRRESVLIEINADYAESARRNIIGDAPLFAQVQT